MNIRVSPDASIIFSGGSDVFYMWKRNATHRVAYDVFYTHQLTNRQSFSERSVSCFSSNSKVAGVVYSIYDIV